MKNLRRTMSGLGLLAALLFAGGPSAAVFQITVDTSSVSGASGWLVFDLVDGGDGPTPSSVLVQPFSTDGTLGAGITRTGGVTGTLTGPVTLADTDFFNEYMQDITVGNSISFTFETSGTAATGTPDGFSFFLLAACDPNAPAPNPTNGCVPWQSLLETSDPSGALFLFNIGAGFEGGTPYSDSVTATPVANDVPEPGSLALGMAALLALGVSAPIGRRRVMQVPRA